MALNRCQGGKVSYPPLHPDADDKGLVRIKKSSLRTMESVRSAFHAQLATVMDSLLAAAVCEIAKIFESSLCEQQAELAQKTEEISILRSKLEKAERRQKVKSGGSEEGEMTSGRGEGAVRTGSGIKSQSFILSNTLWASA